MIDHTIPKQIAKMMNIILIEEPSITDPPVINCLHNDNSSDIDSFQHYGNSIYKKDIIHLALSKVFLAAPHTG